MDEECRGLENVDNSLEIISSCELSWFLSPSHVRIQALYAKVFPLPRCQGSPRETCVVLKYFYEQNHGSLCKLEETVIGTKLKL